MKFRMAAELTRGGLAAYRSLAAAPAKADAAMVEILNDAGQQVFAVSQRYVPVLTGNLKGSGTWDPATRTKLATTIEYAADYALLVHETHGSKSHYLTRAVDLVMDNLPKDAADVIIATWR